MKHYTATFIFVLIIALSLTGMAAAQVDKHFNPDVDTVISCDAVSADYAGKTFDGDVYVLLNGCDNLKSSVIPGDNTFLTLRDVTVNGTLYFVDDTYDAATGTYRESLSYDTLTRANHFLNLAGSSYVENLYMECMNPHDCSLGLQYPTEINNLYIVPTNAATRGKMTVRGYIDPLTDPETDYYADTAVASFPGFDFNTFDADFALGIAKKYKIFIREAQVVSNNGILYGSRGRDEEYYSEMFIDKYPYKEEVAATEIYFKRGKVNNLFIYNKYAIGAGETDINLINLFVELAMINNGKTIDSTTSTDFARVWVPVLRAGGFTNIGIMSVYSQLKTDVLLEAEDTMPLYIDAMVVGTEGLTEKITLESTKIAMLNYLGGLSPYSVLDLTFTSPDTAYFRHIPSVGILMAHGGKVNLTSNSYFQEILHIGAFYLLNGRDDLRFAADTNGVSSAEAFMKLPVLSDNTSRTGIHGEGEARTELTGQFNERYAFDSGDIYERTLAQGTTAAGGSWISAMLDEYSSPASDDVKQASTTKIVLSGISFGDLVVDKQLNDTTKSNWFGASCAVHQNGDRSTSSPEIKFITK